MIFKGKLKPNGTNPECLSEIRHKRNHTDCLCQIKMSPPLITPHSTTSLTVPGELTAEIPTSKRLEIDSSLLEFLQWLTSNKILNSCTTQTSALYNCLAMKLSPDAKVTHNLLRPSKSEQNEEPRQTSWQEVSLAACLRTRAIMNTCSVEDMSQPDTCRPVPPKHRAFNSP